jgi:hypothetical protein
LWPVKHSPLLKSSCSGCIHLVSPCTSPFNSFSKFYCKFTCSLDAPSPVFVVVVFMVVFCSHSTFSCFNCLWSIDTHHHLLNRKKTVWCWFFLYSFHFQIDYLRTYGYLPSKTSRFGADILHEDVAINALKALQVGLKSVTCLSSWAVYSR